MSSFGFSTTVTHCQKPYVTAPMQLLSGVCIYLFAPLGTTRYILSYLKVFCKSYRICLQFFYNLGFKIDVFCFLGAGKCSWQSRVGKDGRGSCPLRCTQSSSTGSQDPPFAPCQKSHSSRGSPAPTPWHRHQIQNLRRSPAGHRRID